MEDILYFFLDVLNGVEIRGMSWPINSLNSVVLQPLFDFPRIMNWGIVLLKKGPGNIILE